VISIRNQRDFIAGILLLAVAGIFGYGAYLMPLGRAARMGPGYFPLVLSILLAVVALAILVNSLKKEGEGIEQFSVRPMIFVTLSILFFGFALKGLGLVPTLSGTILLSTFASMRWSGLRTFLLIAILVPACALIFVKGLGLVIPLYGPWIGGG